MIIKNNFTNTNHYLTHQILSLGYTSIFMHFLKRHIKAFVSLLCSNCNNSITYQLRSLSTLNMDIADKSWRLSPLVRPEHYNLLLRPDMNNGSFYGAVRIDVNVKESVNCLRLNTKFLQISDISVNKESITLHVTKFTENKDSEQLLIHFGSVLNAGDYQISINYMGSLTNGIVGLYLSHLTDKRLVFCITLVTKGILQIHIHSMTSLPTYLILRLLTYVCIIVIAK